MAGTSAATRAADSASTWRNDLPRVSRVRPTATTEINAAPTRYQAIGVELWYLLSRVMAISGAREPAKIGATW
ncbi:hypothetical protein D3C86_2152970 [compost metagenome]